MWQGIRLVTQNLCPQEFYPFSKLWVIGIDGLMNFKGLQCIRLKISGFEMNRPHTVGAENWEVIMCLFWEKHFAAADIL